MYLPRPQIAQLYTHLTTTTHPSSQPILILTALTVDALCATRILTALLKRDFVPHKVQPVSGYSELQQAGREHVAKLRMDRGGEGGLVVCVGCGGTVELGRELGLTDKINEGTDEEEDVDVEGHGVEVWVLDARRPWDLKNIFGSTPLLDVEECKKLGIVDGRIGEGYRGGPAGNGKGGIVVWDCGEIEEGLQAEREAWASLMNMPEITEADLADEAEEADAEDGAGGEEDEDEDEPASSQSRKRKAPSQPAFSDDEGSDDERPRQRRRSNTGTPIPTSPSRAPPSNQYADSSPGAVVPSSPPPPRQLSLREQRRELLTRRRKYEAVLDRYAAQGSWTAEPVSSMLYSLASELGREDNELLWLAIVGIESVSLSPFSGGSAAEAERQRRVLGRMDQVKEVLRDEVRRLNPVPEVDLRRSASQQLSEADIPTHARSPTDNSIRLSPEPRFLLIRHWSLYDSMLHSPYLSTRLHVWSEQGRKRLNKLLAKMGISLQEANKGYLHLDMEIKRSLRKRILKFAEQYNLDGLVPAEGSEIGYGGRKGWGFVRSWGWRGTMSAVDVATVVSAILEVGPSASEGWAGGLQDLHIGGRDVGRRDEGYSARASRAGLPSPPHSSDSGMDEDARVAAAHEAPDWTTRRFFAAYDALSPATTNVSHTSKPHHHHAQGLPALLASIPLAQGLAKAILRTGSALIAKSQVRHLRSFRMGVVKEGPDVATFTHPGALTKLAAWLADALAVLDAEKGRRPSASSGGEALVLGALDEGRSTYVVVGLGGGDQGGGGGYKTKAEIKERAERRKRRAAAKAAEKAEKARKKAEEKQRRRERLEALGELDSDEDGFESDATESNASSSSSSGSDSEDGSDTEGNGEVAKAKKGALRNRFGKAFFEVVEQTSARVRIDSFESSVVEVRKEDFAGFLEALSLRSVVG